MYILFIGYKINNFKKIVDKNKKLVDNNVDLQKEK